MKTIKNNEAFNIISMIPPILILTILPMIIRLYVYDNGMTEYPWMAEDGQSMDLFLHGKMIFFEVLLLVMCVCFAYYVINHISQMHFPTIFICIIGYMLFALMSTLFSSDRSFGFTGIHEQFESVWCLLGYALIIIYMYYLVIEQRQSMLLIYALLAFSLIMGIIGTLQFFHIDPVLSDFAKKFYILGVGSDIKLSGTFSSGTVYMTLYNPDYVGYYTALVSPILTVLMYYGKKTVVKILSAISLALMILSTIGSTVASAYIGLAISVMVIIIVSLREIIKSKKHILIAILSLVVVTMWIFGCIALRDRLNAQSSTIVTGTTVTADAASETQTMADDTLTGNADITSTDLQSYKLDYISETDEYVEFSYNGTIFRESLDIQDGYAYLKFVDQNDQPIDYDYDEATMTYTLTPKGLNGITATTANLLDQYVGFITTIDGKSWAHALANVDEHVGYYFFTNGGRLDRSVRSESAIFTDHYNFLNGRGYIWAKTIPLLKHNLLFGSGADTFVLRFPQSDYVSAYKGGYENLIISKPHNMYLQIAVQTGVVSLILLAIFYIWYMAKCLRLYFWKRDLDFEQTLAIAIFAGTAGFLVIALANDSTICVTPVFAVLLGLGVALNRMNER